MLVVVLPFSISLICVLVTPSIDEISACVAFEALRSSLILLPKNSFENISVTGRIVGASDEVVNGNVEVIGESEKNFKARQTLLFFKHVDCRVRYPEYGC